MTHPATITVTGALATVAVGDYLISESTTTDDHPWAVTHVSAPAVGRRCFRTLGSAYLYAQRRQAADDATGLAAWHREVSG